jgi:hypothetical protein
MRLCEELYTSSSSDAEDEIEDEQHIEERAATNSGLGNHPWMRIDYEASESASSSDPSSPRTIRALSVDGETVVELTTICEWPSNLTADNAITAALELVPYHDNALETLIARMCYGPTLGYGARCKLCKSSNVIVS